MKRTVSMVLVITMILSIFTVCALPASALTAPGGNPDISPAGTLPLDGTAMSGEGYSMGEMYALSFILEQSGSIDFEYSMDAVKAEMLIQQLGTDANVIALIDAKKGDYQTGEVRQRTVYLEKGKYLLVLSERDMNTLETPKFSVSAVFTAFKIQEPEHGAAWNALALPANQTLSYAYTQWNGADAYKIVVKKDYRIVLSISHEMPIVFSGIFTENPYKNYSALTRFDSGSKGKAAKETVALNLKKGTYYCYLFQKTAANEQYEPQGGMYSLLLEVKPFLTAPKGLKAVVRQTNRQDVSFQPVPGAFAYQVQCSDGGTKWAYSIVDNSTRVSFTGLTPGGKYKFRVRTIVKENGKNVFSAWSEVLSSCAKPATAKIKAISTPKKGQIKTTWAKAGGVVSGYQVQFSKNKSFTQIVATKTIKTDRTLSYLGQNLTSGRSYYVRVRAYTVFNGNFYGAWSAAKAIKVR